MTLGDQGIRVFISYSHDSPEHVERVLALADRLRRQGIDAHLDQYEYSPPQGWPRWMHEQIEEADFVLIVCTEVYLRRITGKEEPGRGLGAQWEGAIITQALYDNQGRNEKFIPVLFSVSAVPSVPRFIKGSTYYNVSEKEGYLRLYRHLTGQPRVVKPELGPVVEMPPEQPGVLDKRPVSVPTEEAGDGDAVPDLFLLMTADYRHHLLLLHESESSDKLRVKVSTSSPEDTSLLSELQGANTKPVGIVFGETALLARVESVTQSRVGGEEVWTLIFAPEPSDYGAGLMEMGTSTYSVDDLAEMRARRILLDEKPRERGRTDLEWLNEGMMEYLVRGQGAPIQVTGSPFPSLYTQYRDNIRYFLAVARLFAILWLRLSGVVEHIWRLDLTMKGDEALEVDFEGRRPRKYANVDPTVIRVRGTCQLK